MKKEELVQRLEDIEWEDFEVKEAKSEVPKSSWETVSAFSNTSGGWLIFGVKKEGKEYAIQGVSNAEKLSQDFIGVLRSGEKFNKKIDVKCEKYDLDGNTVLAFYILSSEKKPVYYGNLKNTFLRSGSGDQRAIQEEIDAMLRDSAFGTKDKETTKFSLEDLDKDTLNQFKNHLKNLDPTNPYNNLTETKLLVHSDYFSTMKPRIRVFLDRIEFMNPGSLPFSVDILRKQELTLPRNPILIKIFRILKLVENARYGFDKMFNGWQHYYKVEPLVENEITHYIISFPFNKNVPEKDLEKDLEKLNPNQRTILQEIIKNKYITQKELSKILGINEKNVRNNIAKLKEIGIIRRIGPDKGGYWEIIEK